MLSLAQASVLEAKYEKLKEEGKVRFDKLKEQSNNRKAELAEARQQVRLLRHWGYAISATPCTACNVGTALVSPLAVCLIASCAFAHMALRQHVIVLFARS